MRITNPYFFIQSYTPISLESLWKQLIQYNNDNWKLKGYGNLLPLIHGASYPGFLYGHGDSGKMGSYGRFFILICFKHLIDFHHVCVCVCVHICLNQNNNTLKFTLQ